MPSDSSLTDRSVQVETPGGLEATGPVSEIAALGILATVWLGDASASEAAKEATSEASGS